ncbi:MAG: hypothetical protein GY765_16600 [bacterium]|nr:hypothetical protein [bacterium]
MKTKKMKLQLKKKTVANLNANSMSELNGGVGSPGSEQGITIPPCSDDGCVAGSAACNTRRDCPSVPAAITCFEPCITAAGTDCL